MIKTSVSLLITTYNWIEALEVCLLSVARQTVLPSEVLIADDGSGPETAEFIKHISVGFPCPIVHVWQEDLGFRAGVIRNKAIAKASGEYIIQIDGDIILHPRFIQDHLSVARPNCFIAGSRTLVSKEYTCHILQSKKINISIFSKGITHKLNGVRNFLLRRYYLHSIQKRFYYAKSCNLSSWKSDLIAVNGYNEDITGWGCEDWELAARLVLSGKEKLKLKFGGVQYHLFHNEVDRKHDPINSEILEKTIKNKTVFAKNGLDKYL